MSPHSINEQIGIIPLSTLTVNPSEYSDKVIHTLNDGDIIIEYGPNSIMISSKECPDCMLYYELVTTPLNTVVAHYDIYNEGYRDSSENKGRFPGLFMGEMIRHLISQTKPDYILNIWEQDSINYQEYSEALVHGDSLQGPNMQSINNTTSAKILAKIKSNGDINNSSPTYTLSRILPIKHPELPDLLAVLYKNDLNTDQPNEDIISLLQHAHPGVYLSYYMNPTSQAFDEILDLQLADRLFGYSHAFLEEN